MHPVLSITDSSSILMFEGSVTVYSGLEGPKIHEARMINSDYTGQYPVDAVTIEKFAELIGKTDEAVRVMIKREKLPVVDFQDRNKSNLTVPQKSETLGLSGLGCEPSKKSEQKSIASV